MQRLQRHLVHFSKLRDLKRLKLSHDLLNLLNGLHLLYLLYLLYLLDATQNRMALKNRNRLQGCCQTRWCVKKLECENAHSPQATQTWRPKCRFDQVRLVYDW